MEKLTTIRYPDGRVYDGSKWYESVEAWQAR
jgi:hypothetical protein